MNLVSAFISQSTLNAKKQRAVRNDVVVNTKKCCFVY